MEPSIVKGHAPSAGFTFIEAALVIAVFLIMIIAVSLFIGRGFDLSRTSTEQARITEDARNQMERMGDTLRNAQDLDTNGDGVPEADWLITATNYEIIFYANVDADPQLERVRYTLNGTNLERGVIQPNPGGGYPPGLEQVTVVARSLRNRETLPNFGGVPLFVYYRNADGIESVQAILVVDTNPNRPPPPATISTIITPRQPS